ncbi:uncharacterized mitochondrial protein-like protein [Tanacetum coccineum]
MLNSLACGHELFIKAVHGSSSFSLATVAFVAESGRFSSSFGSGFYPYGGRSGGHGRGRRPPHCQLCRQTSHYADKCPDLHTFANRGSSLDVNLAQAFHAKYGVYDDFSNWFIDSGASTHMASSSASLDYTMPYTGSDHVIVANGNILNISRIGNTSIAKDIDLLDVLVVFKITKNLLFISKLTADSPVDILFSCDMFTIQNRHTKDILAKGRCENGLYVLTQGHKALVAGLKSNRLHASYELWHSRLGHVKTLLIIVSHARAERKHRYVTETRLAMLFNANAPASLWVKAFTSAVYIINHFPTKLLDKKSSFEQLFNRAPNSSHMPSHAQPPTNTYPMTTRAKPKGYKSAAKNSKWITAIKEEMAALKHNDIRADTSLFVFQRENFLLYLLIYVDDIILTGNKNVLISQFISRLNKEFSIKDIGKLSYFLGLEVAYNDKGLFLTQAKYDHDILSRAGFLHSKPVSTLLSAYANLTTNGDPFSDPTLYCSLVGALQYLTITKPKLSYAVNQVSKFLHAPTNDYFQAVKLILRYVKGNLSFGLAFNRSPCASLTTFYDADWARCTDTRCESEYRDLANTASEVVWLTSLLCELQVPLPSIPVLYCDNKSAIFLSQNPVAYK